MPLEHAVAQVARVELVAARRETVKLAWNIKSIVARDAALGSRRSIAARLRRSVRSWRCRVWCALGRADGDGFRDAQETVQREALRNAHKGTT